MKMKQVLFVSVVIMLTAITGDAQVAKDIHPAAKEIIPFGKRLPPPDLKNLPGKRLQGNLRNDVNRIITPGLKLLNAKEIKKDPNSLKQLLHETRNNRIQTNGRYPVPAAGLETIRPKDFGNNNDKKPDFHLAKDINTLAESFPTNYDDFDPYPSYAVLNGVIYFAADDGIHGNELWRSDGTEEGTYMVKDISPGSASTVYLLNITAANGKIFFSAYTTDFGYEPWVSDGTESGTHLLMDIAPGSGWSFPTEFVSLGNTVYFVTDINDFIWGALWKTDGTTSGTTLLRNFTEEGNGSEFISQLTVANNLVFFSLYSFNSFAYELWRTDGSSKGTYHVGKSGSFYYGVPAQFTNYNNQLYFSAEDSTGRKLWMSDGTDAGTKPAPNNNDVLIYAEQIGIPFPVLNNALCVPSTSGINYIGGLYKYDASNSKGFVKLKDLAGTDPNIIVPAEMTVVNDILYFRVLNLNGGLHDELWSSKGSPNTTQLVQKFSPGVAIYNLCNGNGSLYFGRTSKALGTELWSGINTPYGTLLHPVSNVFKGGASSNPLFLTAFKGKVFFSAIDDKKGTELFMTGGTPFSTLVVKDINTTSSSGSYPAYFKGWINSIGNDVLFDAYENNHGFELYRSNGSAGGTKFLNDILPGESGSYPEQFLSKNKKGYFIAQNTDTTLSIYKTDGTTSGLQKITPNYVYYRKEIVNFDVADNGLMYFVLFNYYTFAYELWRTDGTVRGTFLLSKALYFYNALQIVNNMALFVAGDANHGYELWRSDGSIKGTRLVRDINPGRDDAAPGGLFVYNKEVYFGAYDGANRSFWKSDGTKAGTVKLKNIDLIYENSPDENTLFFGISNNILYFSAIMYGKGKGVELWKTDGTDVGTQAVKDINPNDTSVSGIPFYLTDVNGTLFFIADDGEHGEELWKSDGTTKGTQMVVDLTKGNESGFLDDLVSYGGKLYFTNNYTLWSSDGTADGTIPVNDAVISEVLVNNIVTTSNQLFLSGHTYRYGWELYTGKIDDTGIMAMSKATVNEAVKTTVSFDAILYPNPVSSNAKLQITGNVKSIAVFITDMNGKQLWQSNNINTSLITLPVKKLAAGTYFVTVNNGKESKTIKLLKQ